MFDFRALDALYGNEQLKKYFISAVRAGTLPPAHIVSGAKGSGKLTFALAAASALTGISVERIKSANTPDVYILGARADRKTIGVDIVRSIKESAYIRPGEADAKVYILTGAHTMTIQAQNAFLKLLEEPPENVYFFLLCENLSAMLPTVQSRAPTLRMQRFSDDELIEYLNRDGKKLPKDKLEYALRNADGCIGEAVELINLRGKDAKTEKVNGLIELLANPANRKSELFLYVPTLSGKRDELIELLADAQRALRDIATLKRGASSQLMFYSDPEDARRLADRFTNADITRLYEAIESVKLDLNSNINVQTALIILADKMLRAVSE